MSLFDSEMCLNSKVKLDRLTRHKCMVLYYFMYGYMNVTLILHISDAIRQTIRGLQQHVGVLNILNVGLEEFGQMAMPSMCHLQYKQKKTDHKIDIKTT